MDAGRSVSKVTFEEAEKLWMIDGKMKKLAWTQCTGRS
jgi:hypothetical protein